MGETGKGVSQGIGIGIGIVIALTGLPVLGFLMCGGAFVGISEMGRRAEDTFRKEDDARPKPSMPAGTDIAPSPKPPRSNDIPAPVEREPPPAKPKPVDVWEQAGAVASLDDVTVKLIETSLRKPGMIRPGGDRAEPSSELTVVRVRITNRSATRKINFKTWGTGFFDIGSGTNGFLRDEHGNVYPRISPSSLCRWEGQADHQSIAPGESHEDLLVFDPPIPAAREMRLELPGENVDLKGEIRLKWAVAEQTRPPRSPMLVEPKPPFELEGPRRPSIVERVVPKPTVPERPPREKQAQSKLRVAKTFLRTGDTEKAKAELDALVKQFGETEAAKEAAELLKK